MSYLDSSLVVGPSSYNRLSAQDCEPLFRSSILCCLFQANLLSDQRSFGLLDHKLFLDVSWDDLRDAIASLRPIFGEDIIKMRALSRFVAEHLSPEPTLAALALRLAPGSVRLLKEMATGQKPSYFRWVIFTQGIGSSHLYQGIIIQVGLFRQVFPPFT
jgi:hypothetical protein